MQGVRRNQCARLRHCAGMFVVQTERLHGKWHNLNTCGENMVRNCPWGCRHRSVSVDVHGNFQSVVQHNDTGRQVYVWTVGSVGTRRRKI